MIMTDRERDRERERERMTEKKQSKAFLQLLVQLDENRYRH
jgi:hypothetical protein